MPTFVVPLDGSSFAERSLRPAAALAARHARRSGRGRVLRVACNWLASLTQRFGSGDREVHARVLHGTPASRAIRLFAEDLPASLIARATHGRTGPARSALGSVASDVTRTAPCPVLLRRSMPGVS